MEEFVLQLEAYGLSHSTVDVASMKGAGSDGLGSSWKTYYRSCDYPVWGVLIVRDSNLCRTSDAAPKLELELRNYSKLRAAGCDVPWVHASVLNLEDHIGGIKVSAIVVEHIDGAGIYHVYTQHRSVMMVGNLLSCEARDAARRAWDTLKAAMAHAALRDLQVFVTPAGRIVVVDPEQLGPGRRLPDWNDALFTPAKREP